MGMSEVEPYWEFRDILPCLYVSGAEQSLAYTSLYAHLDFRCWCLDFLMSRTPRSNTNCPFMHESEHSYLNTPFQLIPLTSLPPPTTTTATEKSRISVFQEKKWMATSAFHQRNVIWRHLFGIRFRLLSLPLPSKSKLVCVRVCLRTCERACVCEKCVRLVFPLAFTLQRAHWIQNPQQGITRHSENHSPIIPPPPLIMTAWQLTTQSHYKGKTWRTTTKEKVDQESSLAYLHFRPLGATSH